MNKNKRKFCLKKAQKDTRIKSIGYIVSLCVLFLCLISDTKAFAAVKDNNTRQTKPVASSASNTKKASGSQESKSDSEQTKPIKIRVAFYPLDGFFEYDKTGKEIGYGVDYLNEMAKYANIQWEYVPVDSWEKINGMLRSGQVDVEVPVTVPDDEEKAADYNFTTEDILPSYHALMAYKSRNDLYYKDYDTIKTIKIAVTKQIMETAGVERYLRSIGVPPDHLLFFEDYNHCKEAVYKGQADALVSNVMDLKDNMKILDKFAVSKNYIVTMKENPYYTIINAAMTELELENPSFQADLYEKYYPRRSVEPFTKKEIRYMKKVAKIKVGVYTDRQPASYYDADQKKFKGILIDLAERVSQNINIKFEYVPITTANPKKMLNKVDVIIGINQGGNTLQYFTTSNIIDSEILFAIREGEAKPKKGDIVAIVKTAEGIKRLVKLQGKYKIRQYENGAKAMQALQAGEVDCYANSSYIINWQLENPRYGNLCLLNYESIPMEYSFCGKAGNTLLQSVLNKGLSAIGKEQQQAIIKEDTNFSMNDLSLGDQIFVYRYLITVIIILLVVGGVSLLLYSLKKNQYMQRIQEKTEQAQKANLEKSQFLSRMSHDMRTPMNGIMGISYLMEKEKDITVIRGYVKDLQESGKYLLQLINDILDLNKIESGKLELHQKPGNDFRIYKTILDIIRPAMQEKNIHFYYEKDNTQSQNLMLDEQRVKQIFINLLSNAAKFTPEGGKVSFVVKKLSQDEDMVYKKYVIEDNGIGMAAEFLPHVYEQFKREERGSSTAQGSGLGLAIVKKLIDLMGGTISIDSEVDRGTKVTIYLNFPLAKQEPDKENIKDDALLQNNEENKYRGLQVLLCEDHPLNAAIARKLLERCAASVTWVQNGEECVKEFLRSPQGYYDILFMDIRMPVMDGLEAARKIRALDREDAKRVVIIAMSANAYEEDIQSSLQAGMNAHLAKPVVPEILYSEIDKYWNKKDTR